MIIEEPVKHGPPRVQITYYGDDEPSVLVQSPPGLEVIVELVDGEEERWLFFAHKGVKVYRTYSNRHGEEYPSENWYSTERRVDDEKDECFEVDELPEVPEELREKYVQLVPVPPRPEAEWRDQVAWEKFKTQDVERQRRMAYAIDQEWLTEDGLDEKYKQ